MKNAWQRHWLFLSIVGTSLATGFFSLREASAAPRNEQARAFAGELGAIVQHDSDGRVAGTLFRVWAPNATTVSVIGTFNGWHPKRHEMKKNPTTGTWEIPVASAKPGDEYLFLINGELRRKDPRARQVTASEGNGVIYDTGAFQWGASVEFHSSGLLKDLVLYQLHPGTFFDPNPKDGNPGTLRDAIKKLDHLKDMGVNGVLLLPVNEFHGRHSWGYNPSDLFAVESAYGGPDALKEFVKACHERGIAVHLDIVHNHYGPQDLSLVRFDGSGGGENKNGIYFYEDAERGDTPWGPRPHFGRKEVRDFIRDNVRMWFQEYKIDGLRWDSTINIRAVNNGRTPNPDGESLLHNISTMIAKEFPGKISIAEDSVGDPRFHSSWEYAYHHTGDNLQGIVPQLVKGETSRRSVADIGSHIKSDLGFRRVIYSENHDEVGLLNDKRRLLAEADPANPLSLTARRKAALAAVVTLTSPGVPLLFMGQELLETQPFHDSNPLDWRRGEKSFHQFQLYRDLVRLRRNLDNKSPALTDVHTRIVKADEKSKLLTWRRYVPGRTKDDLFIVANFSDEPMKSVPVFFPQAGEWSLLLNTDDRKYGTDLTSLAPQECRTDSSSRIAVTLAPLSAQIYSFQKQAATKADLTAMQEEWEAAHGEEKKPESLLSESLVESKMEELETPTLPEYVPFKTDAGQFVVLVNFSLPKPWDPLNPDFKMGIVADYLWRCGMGFPGAFEIAFKILNPATGAQFGGQGLAAMRVPATGTAVEGGPPILIAGPLNGDYMLSFNEKDLRYRFERRADSRYHRISMMGNFNNWNPTADLMTMIADHTWQTDIFFDGQTDAEFVFLADASLEKQWGDDHPPHTALPARGTTQEMAATIRLELPLHGPHRFTFNERTGEYSIEPVPPAEISPLPPVPAPLPPLEIPRTKHPAPAP